MSIVYGKDSTLVVIHSRDRNNGVISDFQINIDLSTSNDYNRVALITCDIPKTYYTVESGSNTFLLVEDGNEKIITVPGGNYNQLSFATVVGNLMTDASFNVAPTYNFTYTVTYPDPMTEADTGKYTFHCSDTVTSVYVQMISRLYKPFGFREDDAISFALGSFESELPCDFERTKYIQLQSDISSNTKSNGSDSTLLACINSVTSTDPFENIHYQMVNLESASRDFYNNKNNTFNFSLLDDHGSGLDLKLDFCMSLLFYRYNPIPELQVRKMHLDLTEAPKRENDSKNGRPGKIGGRRFSGQRSS